MVFNESLAACEDYDLYLRIARQNPVRCHDNVVADYRQHDSNMSRDPEFMLKWALAVHHHQYDYVKGHADRELAYAEGDKYLREYYGNQVFRQLRARFQMSPADFRSIHSLLLQYPILRVSKARMREKLGYLAGTLRRVVRRSTVWPPLGKVRFRAMRSQRPICPTGCNLPSITRWYSDHWIEKWQAHLHGRVLRVCAADLRAGSIESLAPEEYDAVICSLQMQSVYDLDSAIEAMCRALKPSGVLVATLPGVTTAQGADENDFWRFTELSARRLLGQNFPEHSIHVQGFGNVLAGIAGLHGVPADEFSECELQTPGAQHPVVIGVFARKE